MEISRSDMRGKTPEAQAIRSPEWVQMSTAAAMTLGLVPGRMYRNACTHCLNLLLTYPEGCRANCSYCGLARHREALRRYADRNFIRVDWPRLRYDEVISAVRDGRDEGNFERMCISMITHPASTEDTLALLGQWNTELPHIPVSILSNPTTLCRRDLQQLRQNGADIFTVALDAATPELFEQLRGRTVESPHRWQKYWTTLDWAAEIFGPERFGAHLICGLGESEHELLEVCQRIRDMGGHNHLFAFFPERGSLMEAHPPVDRAQWRRVQLARFLIDYRGVRLDEMTFDEDGRLVDFGIADADLDILVDKGTPFRTSGCPGSATPEVSACNRPYGDSPPSDICSFPFSPAPEDVINIRRQMQGEAVTTFAADPADPLKRR
jgi:biotin synthase-related radical SAM superfamily protein